MRFPVQVKLEYMGSNLNSSFQFSGKIEEINI